MQKGKGKMILQNDPFRGPKAVGELHSSPIMRRYAGNPILTAQDAPYPASYLFNAGVTRYRGRYYIAPRIDLLPENGKAPMQSICTGFGTSDDGIHFTLEKEPLKVFYRGKALPWVCDARLTVLEEELYLAFCFENCHSERPGIARWEGGTDFRVVTLGIPQQRNMVLFPEKINGRYMRLERPAVQYGDRFHIWYSFSPDLRYWGESDLLLGCEDVPFANVKIGAGPAPVRTERGWLLIFHAVDDDPKRAAPLPRGTMWSRRYTFGAALFDSDDPTRLTAITRTPLMVAEKDYETGSGGYEIWVRDTLFPCGAVLEEDGRLRIYYGAGDSCVCLAETTLSELWSVMTPASRLADTATVPFR